MTSRAISLPLLAALPLVTLGHAQQGMEPATTSYPAADPDGEVLDEFQPNLEARKSFDVHLHNGKFFVEQTDLVIKGRGFDFVWKRTYRSRADYEGPLGYNWDHSHLMAPFPPRSHRLQRVQLSDTTRSTLWRSLLPDQI